MPVQGNEHGAYIIKDLDEIVNCPKTLLKGSCVFYDFDEKYRKLHDFFYKQATFVLFLSIGAENSGPKPIFIDFHKKFTSLRLFHTLRLLILTKIPKATFISYPTFI